jgi:hypothetical protein
MPLCPLCTQFQRTGQACVRSRLAVSSKTEFGISTRRGFLVMRSVSLTPASPLFGAGQYGFALPPGIARRSLRLFVGLV